MTQCQSFLELWVELPQGSHSPTLKHGITSTFCVQWDKVSLGPPDTVPIPLCLLPSLPASGSQLWSLSRCPLQVCAVSQRAAVWGDEDERLILVPALRHPAWCSQL